jgi:GT2 family glycosyltransferase
VPRLSIVIVTYNSIAQIDACLASVASTVPPIDSETLVVDNASPDGTAHAIRQRWPGVTVVDAGANVGFARANNIGIRRSSGELLLLLNPDTVLRPGAIGRLVHVLESTPWPHSPAPGWSTRKGAPSCPSAP